MTSANLFAPILFLCTLKFRYFFWCNSPFWSRIFSLFRLHNHSQTH